MSPGMIMPGTRTTSLDPAIATTDYMLINFHNASMDLVDVS